MMETFIPFPGFYESILSSELDRVEEMEAENLEDDEGVDLEQAYGILLDCTDHQRVQEEVAKAWVFEYAGLLCEDVLALDLNFKELISPREYNFTTDKVLCTVPENSIKVLFDTVHKSTLSDVCEDHLKSRDGFHSFYDHRWETWGDVTEWDANQVSMLFHALHHDSDDGPVWGDVEEEINYRLSRDSVYFNTVLDSVDWPKVEAKIKELKLVEAGEVEPDTRKFPHPTLTDPDKYALEFDRLNNLKREQP